MNKYFYFEGNVFETREQAELLAKNYNIKRITEIETDKNFEDFENAFDEAKQDGNSDFVAIEFAK